MKPKATPAHNDGPVQSQEITTFPFTRPRLLALPLSDGTGTRTVYWDSDVAGLCCRVGKSKALWFTRWAHGARRWMRIGDPGRTTVELARSLARQFSGQIDAGERPWETRAQDRADEKQTVAALWEAYLDTHALPNKRPNSVGGDCWLWARCIAPAFGSRYMTFCPEGHPGVEIEWTAKVETFTARVDRKGVVVGGTKHVRGLFLCPTCKAMVSATWTGGKLAADLTSVLVRKLHDNITEERGATLANRAVVLLATMFTKAAPDLSNPCAGSQQYRHQETSRERHMASTEVLYFWEAVEAEPAPWPLFFAIAATTGARKSNILAMPWPSESHKEINLSTGEWKIPPHKSKGGKAITITLAPPICDSLRQWRKECPESEWVFPGAGKPEQHAVEPSRAWDRVRWRMEAQRLLVVLSGLEHWAPERLDVEFAGLPELAGRFWRAALGRRESSDLHPLQRVLANVQDRVRAAGGEPSEGTVLDLRFHDIRRSVGAHMAMAGHSETEIGRLLGHAPGSKSTRIYGRIGQDHAARMAALAAATMLNHNPKAAGRVLKIQGASP